MSPRSADSYAKLLCALEADAFEEEVCARLSAIFADFQRIPRKPSGDGGLDGLSHGQTRAYCCYGPEKEFKTDARRLTSDIVAKFQRDLRKLFELEHKTRTVLTHRPTPELGTIIAPGRKLQHVHLVVSWFESHRIVGPLNKAFGTSRDSSKCNCIASTAQPSIWGPKDLATRWAVDEHTLFRLEERALIAKVKQAATLAVSVPTPSVFDAKFDYIRTNGPGSSEAATRLAAIFRKAWGTALALDNELAANSVSLHTALERARLNATVTADLHSPGASTPQELLSKMRTEVCEHLREVFGERLSPYLTQIADGEIARLIGECPVEWRR